MLKSKFFIKEKFSGEELSKYLRKPNLRNKNANFGVPNKCNIYLFIYFSKLHLIFLNK